MTDRQALDAYLKKLAQTRRERELTPIEKAELRRLVREREYLPGGRRLIDPAYVLPEPPRLQ